MILTASKTAKDTRQKLTAGQIKWINGDQRKNRSNPSSATVHQRNNPSLECTSAILLSGLRGKKVLVSQ